MKVLLCAALAAMVLSTGAAFARGSGGDGGESNFAYQLQQQREAYLITGANGGNGGATVLLADAGGGDGGRQPAYA